MMTKQKIRLLISLMGLAALSLMGFQWYWITSALALRNEQFELKVSDALQDVVRKLEKQEIIYLIRQREEIEQQQRKLKALNKNRLAQKTQTPKHRLPDEYTASAGRDGNLTGTNPTDALTPRNRSMTDFQANLINEILRQRNDELPHIERFLRIHAEQERMFEAWFDQMGRVLMPADTLGNSSVMMTVRSSVQKARHPLEKRATRDENEAKSKTLASQTDLLKDVFKDLLFSKRPMEQRVNRLMIDSLLKKSLAERGIGLPYEFAIQNNNQSNVLFSTIAYRPDTTGSELFRASLFPNEINTLPSQLLVYFPERQAFILQNMSFSLISSALLLLVILGCFYVAVTTILKQKKLSDVKNDFINNMTHEFKTPLSTISLAVSMAREQVETPQSEKAKIQRYLGIIRDETQRLGGHVEKVLQMALLDRGEIKLKPTEVNIHDVIEKVLNNLGVQLEQRQGEIELSFEATNELVEADELHLTNILTNLLDNANKYSPEAPHIAVGTYSDDSFVYVSVSDQGRGMTKEQQTKIFDPFYRVPTGNIHDVKGFGLGLSYVKKMVEAHGGAIEVESKLGKGSTFTVKLPLKHD
ncbi:sensor histidine kinase KdpD [Runella sp. SP2]|uniref:sensor histidine kinase n=1 Tax=Runella sp. SP2 TaxID=2268026 RepID=UPI001E40477D|nr:HAMP domain-containing sensor histidine kinase [Runella sp. SP2]